MSSKKLSGAAFKKIRLAKDAEAVRNTRQIDTFFPQAQGLFLVK